MAEETKKRKNEEDIEINLEEPEPLSKKQKRLLKKGKLESSKTQPKVKDTQDDLFEEDNKEDEKKEEPKKSAYSAWVANMSFDTTKDDLKRFIVAKTSQNDDEDKITSEDITRINMPKNKDSGKIKGFAYVDFNTEAQLNACIALSESYLNGRNLLIKNAKSFEGRPERSKGELMAAGKNPPSRILFVGNLSFDTTEGQLEFHYQHCGEIVKIRMATFEDTGKCKGFAFVDFRDIEAATKALTDKRCKKLNGRLLRMEFGEDRSKKVKGGRHNQREDDVEDDSRDYQKPKHSNRDMTNDVLNQVLDTAEQAAEPKKRKSEGRRPRPDQYNGPVKSGLALATAQRGKVGIVPSTGKKTTFD
ncbi:hypothetical protein TRVA0_038S00364 [Trichomonascus vanleenenianus]|uniref:Nop13p n=1 Tax=Trichomonascus vanleenenianus TaxID=2268995 RepID=UPI003ECA3B78